MFDPVMTGSGESLFMIAQSANGSVTMKKNGSIETGTGVELSKSSSIGVVALRFALR